MTKSDSVHMIKPGRTMVRRNYFIELRVLPVLEKAAKKKNVSQGEIVRRAIDAYLVGS